jgi:hypothetical protein
MAKNEDTELQLAFDDTMDYLDRALLQHHPYALAAVMVNLGFSLYKSSLSEVEYDMLIADIYSKRNKIAKFPKS